MLCVCFFVLFFSVHKTVRSADTDEVANLAQHPNSLGTAVLDDRLNFKPRFEVNFILSSLLLGGGDSAAADWSSLN